MNPEEVTSLKMNPENGKQSSMKSRFTNLYCYTSFFCFVSFGVAIITSLGPSQVGMFVSASDLENGCNNIGYCICPREAVCAQTVREIVYLVLARTSIYAVYPFILFMFLSKANHLMARLQHSVFSVYIDFENLHKMHVFGGKVVELATWVHVFNHCLRWGVRDEIHFLFDHVTGRTGLVASIVMPFITWPMLSNYLHIKLGFEYRKGLHYLSWIWGLALMFHASAVKIFYIMGSVLLVYFLNYFLGMYCNTFLVPTTIFRRLETGVSLSFTNPEGFQLRSTSYVLVMLPWISTTEWHAFSVFPHPTEPDHSSLCIAAIGDWSKTVHHIIKRPTARPAYVCGPFPSQFSVAHNCDNILTLVTGIGVTPALSVMNTLNESRQVNLVWMCRDPSLIQYFVEEVQFPKGCSVFIYYTGRSLFPKGNSLPSNVHIFNGRPVLDKVISCVIHSVETSQDEEISHISRSLCTMLKPPIEKFALVLRKIFEETRPRQFFDSCADMDEPSLTPKLSLSLHSLSASFHNIMHQSNLKRSKSRRNLFDVTTSKHCLMIGLNKFGRCQEFDFTDMNTIFETFKEINDNSITWSQFISILHSIGIEIREDSDITLYESDMESSPSCISYCDGEEFEESLKSNMCSTKLYATTAQFVKLNRSIMPTWKVLYCGNSEPVKSSLKQYCKNNGIDLHIESYNW